MVGPWKVIQPLLLTLSVTLRIFVIEGLLTTVVALGSRWLIADWPENARFLDSNERALLIHKLSQDEGTFKMDRLDKKTFKRILRDWKIWIRWISPRHDFPWIQNFSWCIFSVASCTLAPASQFIPYRTTFPPSSPSSATRHPTLKFKLYQFTPLLLWSPSSQRGWVIACSIGTALLS